jgi:hypothetical protein
MKPWTAKTCRSFGNAALSLSKGREVLSTAFKAASLRRGVRLPLSKPCSGFCHREKHHLRDTGLEVTAADPAKRVEESDG